MGGCALNCVANSKIKGKNIWIMPSPGDAGSALGAAALMRKKEVKMEIIHILGLLLVGVLTHKMW
jgi:predicted NodU family carbamoyl transferase